MNKSAELMTVLVLLCFAPTLVVNAVNPAWAGEAPVTAAAAASGALVNGAIHPNAPPELRQFEFMLGEFTRKERLRNPDGSWGDWQPGEWNARFIMGGYGIMDESVNHVTGVHTANIRIFDPQEKQWKVTWLKIPDYATLSAEGRKTGEEIVLKPLGKDQRYIFFDIAKDSYRWRLEMPFNGEYVSVLEIVCQRKKPAPGPDTKK